MKKEIQYLPLVKAISLEDSIGWLSNYKGREENVEHKISNDLDSLDVKNTALLLELGRLNNRREEIINQMRKNSKK